MRRTKNTSNKKAFSFFFSSDFSSLIIKTNNHFIMFHVYEHEMVSGNRFKIGKLNYCFFSISSEGILSLIPANFVFCTNFLFISLRMFSHRIKKKYLAK